MLALPGGAYVYQGDELGLPEVEDLPVEVLQDPIWTGPARRVRGRDGCRVPLPWSGDAPALGFSAAPRPGCRNPRTGRSSPSRRRPVTPTRCSSSTAPRSRSARSLPALANADIAWRDDEPAGVLAFDRGPGFRCVVNLTGRRSRCPPTTRSCSPADRSPRRDRPAAGRHRCVAAAAVTVPVTVA